MRGLRLDPARSRVSRLLVAALFGGILVLGIVSVRGSAAESAEPRTGAISRSDAEALILGSNIGGALESTLGDAFGGVWFDPSTARMHVGVTSAPDRQRARQVAERTGLEDLVVETPVESTWEQLTAAQQRLDDHLADLYARGEVSTAIVAKDNSVLVELGSTVSASRRTGLRRAASLVGVDVLIDTAPTASLVASGEARCKKFEEDKAHCDKPIVGGVTIKSKKNGELCTAGPAILLQDLSTVEKSTATYVLTAGHCIQDGGGVGTEWAAFNKAGEEKTLGKAVEGLKGEKGLVDDVDVGVIKVENTADWAHAGATPVTPAIAPWDPAAEVEPFAVTAQQAVPMEGTKVCVSGQTAGKSCGGVQKSPSVTKTFENGKGEWTAETLAKVEGTTTGGGTSGAPWFLEATPGEVLGTHVGAQVIEGKQFKWYQPLAVSFANLATKYQLLITANEKRKHPGAGPPFTASTYPATVTGASAKSEFLKTEAGTVECSSHLEGTLLGETSTLTLHPIYTECSAFGFLSATVNTEGCDYEVHSPGTLDVVCSGSNSIKIVAGNCKAEIKPQTGLSSVGATNSGEGLTLKPALSSVAYTVTQDGFLCPFSGTGNKTGGTLSGDVQLSRGGGGSFDLGE